MGRLYVASSGKVTWVQRWLWLQICRVKSFVSSLNHDTILGDGMPGVQYPNVYSLNIHPTFAIDGLGLKRNTTRPTHVGNVTSSHYSFPCRRYGTFTVPSYILVKTLSSIAGRCALLSDVLSPLPACCSGRDVPFLRGIQHFNSVETYAPVMRSCR